MDANFNGDDASDILGYTPARPVARSLGDIFHRPWDNHCEGKTVALKPKAEKRDPFLQQLAELMDSCIDTRPGGCDACPNR